MVEHANNPITTFLKKIAKQQRVHEQQRRSIESENSQYRSDKKILMPNYMMAHPRIQEEEEGIESDNNILEDNIGELKLNQSGNQNSTLNHMSDYPLITSISKWRDRIYEMHAWLTKHLLNLGVILLTIIDNMVSKFYGDPRTLVDKPW